MYVLIIFARIQVWFISCFDHGNLTDTVNVLTLTLAHVFISKACASIVCFNTPRDESQSLAASHDIFCLPKKPTTDYSFKYKGDMIKNIFARDIDLSLFTIFRLKCGSVEIVCYFVIAMYRKVEFTNQLDNFIV